MQNSGFKWLVFLASGISLFFCTSLSADAPKGYEFTTYDQGMVDAKKKNKLVFLYFGRHGCGYCEKTNKETFSNLLIKKLYSKNYSLVYMDAESGNRLTLANGEMITETEYGARLNVFATPIFLYLDAQGKVLFRAPGFKTVKDFIDFDKYVQSGKYKTESINQFLSKQK